MGLVDTDGESPLRRDDQLELLAASEGAGSVSERVVLPNPREELSRVRRNLQADVAFSGEGRAPVVPRSLYLRLENVGIASGDASSMWNVYLRVGAGERHVVGTIAPFGLAGLTRSGGRQTLTFDISQIAGEFLADEAAETEVTFEPMYEGTEHRPFWDRVGLYTTVD
jgi:hypothetical protein